MTTYQYQKLTEPDAIRLISLQPSGDLDSPLHCTLLHTTLAKCHNNLLDKYTALSYVWGDPARSQLVRVDNEVMYLTESLNSALRHLRDAHKNRLIWADAICINQDDIDERNQQVKQMGLVYRQANHTVIYLGKGTPETKLFLNVLQSKDTVDYFASLSSSISIARQRLNAEVEEAAREWILSRPWFKRVWILQELVLSQDPWIQCGTSFARWSSLYSHISEIAKQRSLKPEEEIVEHMGNLHLQNRLDGGVEDLPPFASRLYNILKSRKGFGVTDPRDMLFANLGLIGHAVEDEDKLSNLILVNYQKNEGQVYGDLARYFLENLGFSSIFSLLDLNEKRKESQAPSWTPDWTTRPPSEFSRLSDVLAYDLGDVHGPNSIWASQSRVLVCGATCLGEVQELTAVIDQSLSPQIARGFSELLQKGPVLEEDLYRFIKSAFNEMYQKWRHLLGASIPDPARVLQILEDRYYNRDDNLRRRVKRTIRDKKWRYDIAWGHQEHLITRDIFTTISALMYDLNYQKVDLRLIYEKPRPWSGMIDKTRSSSLIRNQSLLAQLVFSSFVTDGPNPFYSRRIATLSKGYIALVPGATKIGDVVSMPINDRDPFPLVLRACPTIDEGLDTEIRQQVGELDDSIPSVEHVKVIGECFVQEWMHGGDPYLYEEASYVEAQYQLLAIH
ncbi:HET-domain-containing protein [Stipitochalara longipes BDJ]|nr:HET-domain-containing protein [Stipitochalara longipes BDJ]